MPSSGDCLGCPEKACLASQAVARESSGVLVVNHSSKLAAAPSNLFGRYDALFEGRVAREPKSSTANVQ